MSKILIFTLILISHYLIAKKPLLVIALDSYRYDQIKDNSYLEYLQSNGIKSSGLEPVFPVKSFPNLISLSTGLYPISHGIIANKFENIKKNEVFSIEDSASISNQDWYYGKFIWDLLADYGKVSACYNWPGSNIDSELKSPEVQVFDSDIKPSDFALTMLSNETYQLADLIMIYLNENNLFYEGLNSNKFDDIISNYDNKVKAIFDNLKQNGIYEFNYIIVSSGGLVKINKDKLISIENEINNYKDLSIQNYGSFCIIDGDKNRVEEFGSKLNLRDGLKVFIKPNYPAELHFDNSALTGKALVLADDGRLILNKNIEQTDIKIVNANGYSSNSIEMQGIFIAGGPDIEKKNTGTIKIIDVYALICKLMGVPIPENIDSSIDNLKFILK